MDARIDRNSEQGHECVFVEEQEPSPDGNHPGRLILIPCIVCGLTAMDALERLREQNDGLALAVRMIQNTIDKIEEWAKVDDALGDTPSGYGRKVCKQELQALLAGVAS